MARGSSSSDGAGAALFVLFLVIWFIVKFFWWIVAASTMVAGYYLLRAVVRDRQAQRAAFTAHCAQIAAHADQQHEWVLSGDDRGIYGPRGAALMREIGATAGGWQDTTRPGSGSTPHNRSAAERRRRS